MQPVEIRLAEKFPEPSFSALKRQVYADILMPSAELTAVLREEAQQRQDANHAHSPMVRFGAYAGAELVGWTAGWMERGGIFYMANSGVVGGHRRQGLYTALLGAIREHAISLGAVILRSQHSVTNNAVIIAKLKNGFVIGGLSQSAEMGTLVELVCHLGESRRRLFRQRVLPYVEPVNDEIV